MFPSFSFFGTALTVAPILSLDESILYQVGASTELYCIDAKAGTVLWRNEEAMRSAIYAEPKLIEFTDEPKLYVIEGMNGRVRQHDALSGEIDWQFDCSDVSNGPCHDAIEAEFSYAPNGNVLYYGDIFGKIVALDIAAFPTTAPTTAPTEEATQEATDPVNEEEAEEEEEEVTDIAGTSTNSPTFAPYNNAGDEGTGESGSYIDNEKTTSPTNNGGDDNDEDADTEIGASAAAASNADNEDTSFFSNEIIIILISVCGALTLAVVAVLVVRRTRKTKNTKLSKEGDITEDDGRNWGSALDDYEEECRHDEEETLREIVSASPITPQKGGGSKKSSKNKQNFSPVTPSTLASIEESPAECDLSFVSDASPKNLEKSFVDVSYNENKTATKADVEKESNPSSTKTEEWSKVDDDKAKDSQAELDQAGPPDLLSVEVVKSPTFPKNNEPKSPIRVLPDHECPDSPDYAANDIMSVDGSLYLDDDSLIKGDVEVASLAQYSYASTKEEIETTLGDYSGEENAIKFEPANGDADIPGSHYLRPPSKASTILSPKVAEYLRRNKSPLVPTPNTTKEPAAPMPNDSSTSPVTPQSASNSPQEDAGPGRVAARAGQSVRRGGSGLNRGPSRELSPRNSFTNSTSRGRSPSPEPPLQPTLKTEEAEPEDAWNSFLNELAKAEREFFSPSYAKKKQPERGVSPPPPPPSYSPPESPGTLTPPPPLDP